MGVINKIQNDCRKATLLIEKRSVQPLGFREWCELCIHLAGCSLCRLFLRQSRMINVAIRDLFHRKEEGEGRRLDEEAKREMQEQIEERLK
jgi:hypothetical protein